VHYRLGFERAFGRLYYKWFAHAPGAPQFISAPKFNGSATLTAKNNVSTLTRCND
jgi:hypothetical protein